MAEDIGSKIRTARKRAGLKQKELAERIGVSESRISQYESGLQHPRFDTIQKIADGLRITPFELIGPEWIDLQLGPEKLADLRESVGKVKALEQYLKSLGYSLSYEGSADTDDPDVVLTKDKEKTTFTGDQFKEFEKALAGSVDYQVWQQRHKK